MLKRSKRFFAMMATALILVGCGNSSKGEGAKTTDGKKEITWMGFGQPQETEVYEQVIKKFEEKYPDVKVKLVSTTQDQYGQKIQAAMASNTMADVVYMGPGDVKAWVNSGKMLNLDEYIEKAQADGIINLDDIWELALKKYKYDGELIGEGSLYALPKDVGPFGFGYNKTLFEKLGIPLPDKEKPYTWEEFMEVSKKLTNDTGGEDSSWGTGLNVNWSLQPFVYSNGADWLNEDATKVTVTDPKFVEALQFFADQTLKYKITPSAEQAQTLDTYQRWIKGQLAFFAVAPWDIAAFEELPFEYDLIPWPAGSTGETSSWLGSVGFAVSANTKYPQEAVNLAIFLSTDVDANKMVADKQIQVPNIKSLAKDYYLNTDNNPQNKQVFIDLIEKYGKPLPGERTYNAEWYNKFFEGIQDVLDGKISAKDYCEKVEPEMQALLDKAIEKEAKEKAKN
ncbi:sugar ABC transporter substrate-binding protein [Clostridium sp. AL.422]|uniref:ABC transporter substrate-binding protein n=1 Tax=Clostridium TaxID=1485 RepID=UPI00293DB13C|nr:MULTISPECIES: sugar ABC transporter substrate-binding protein [unclassified Clostridium]MDV4150876.1 sugar ABC transporter substrate-binding protein [Clostridium sp. AL.422]